MIDAMQIISARWGTGWVKRMPHDPGAIKLPAVHRATPQQPSATAEMDRPGANRGRA